MSGECEADAPMRIDLAGGWTDVPPYTHDHGGEVVNFAINHRVKVHRNEEGEFESSSSISGGSGLGSSSAFHVACVGLENRDNSFSVEEIAELAYQREIASGNRCGRQDQFAAALGGFNRLMFIGESVEVMPFEPMNSALNFLKKHLILVNSGITHESGELHSKVWSRYEQGDEEIIAGLAKCRLASRKMAEGLQRDQRSLIVESLRETSDGVDLIDKGIHDPFRGIMDELLATRSIMAWKAVGAGAGGCAILLCSPIGKERVIDAIESKGWQIIEWSFEDDGLRIF